MMNKRVWSINLVFCLLSMCLVCDADVSVATIFQNGLVLQRGTAITIWGHAKAGEKITASINDSQSSTTCKDTDWVLKLPAQSAGGPYTLTVSGQNTITINDVYIGDVWLTAGDENIGLPLSLSIDATSSIRTSSDNNLRLYSTPAPDIYTGSVSKHEVWQAATSLNITNFSASAFYFGRQLRQQTNVPVGIIVSSCANSHITSWINPKTPLQSGVDSSYRNRFDGSYQFTNAIAPIARFAIKGVIWYHGKSDVANAYLYRYLLSDLIRGWRNAWGNNDLPFVIVQLPGKESVIDTYTPSESIWAEMRDSQNYVSQSVKNTYLTNIIDLTEVLEDVPQNKRLIAVRIALTALGKIYRLPVEYTGARFSKVSILGNQAAVSFTNVGAGLVGRTGSVVGFTIAGDDKVWYPADAYIVGDRIFVSSVYVLQPTAVRFAWSDNPEVNLYNQAGFPTYPFRTDKWPVTTQPSEFIDQFSL